MTDSTNEPIRVGSWTFDRADYDAAGDVLYLHPGDPADAVDYDASDEGHGVRLDAGGQVIGLTIVNARWLIDHDGAVVVTLAPQRAVADDLARVLDTA